MFESLSQRLGDTFRKLSGRGRISQENVRDAMGEVRTVFDFVLDYGWAGLGAGFGPALILSLLWRRTTGWGVLAGMIVGVVTAIAWKQFPALHRQLYNLVPAFALSALTVVVFSLLSEGPADAGSETAQEAGKKYINVASSLLGA